MTDHLLALKELAEKYAPPTSSVIVIPDPSGQLRWLTVSSTAYEDREGEIISFKAHEEDLARMEADKNFGVLRWWHIGAPESESPADYLSWKAGAGVDLGACDFAAMHGRVRIESGTFASKELGEAIQKIAPRLSVSQGFSFPPDGLDRAGVFAHIHTFERSLLPQGRQAMIQNFATLPIIQKELSTMTDEKLQALKTLLGNSDLVDKFLEQITAAEGIAEKLGVRTKEAAPPAPANEAAPAPTFVTPEQLEAFGAKMLEALRAEIAQGETTKTKALADGQLALKELSAQLTEINTRLKGLEGDQPLAVTQGAGYRASGDPATVTSRSKEFSSTPPRSGIDAFLDFATSKQK